MILPVEEKRFTELVSVSARVCRHPDRLYFPFRVFHFLRAWDRGPWPSSRSQSGHSAQNEGTGFGAANSLNSTSSNLQLRKRSFTGGDVAELCAICLHDSSVVAD